MSKKIVLSWLCVASTICSLAVNGKQILAEDVDSHLLPTSEQIISDSSETTSLSTETATAETEVAVTSQSDETSPATTASQENEMISEVVEETAEPSSEVEIPKQEAFSTDFDTFDESTAQLADWSNGSMFNARWTPSNVAFSDGIMTLTIDNDGKGGYNSGEWRTQQYYHYGKYEVRMKPISNPGTVSSFFTYTGPSDGTQLDEIDIEFVGYDTTKVQFNYFTNGVGGHEHYYNLGFDASEEFHTYAFDWKKDSITWFVDGVAVHTATTDIPTTPGKIMMNAWPGIGVDEWLKPFDGNVPLVASYDWMKYTPNTVELPESKIENDEQMTNTTPEETSENKSDSNEGSSLSHEISDSNSSSTLHNDSDQQDENSVPSGQQQSNVTLEGKQEVKKTQPLPLPNNNVNQTNLSNQHKLPNTSSQTGWLSMFVGSVLFIVATLVCSFTSRKRS